MQGVISKARKNPKGIDTGQLNSLNKKETTKSPPKIEFRWNM